MSSAEIVQRLRSVMEQSSEEEVDWGSLTGDTTIESLGFDSLAILDLIYDIQQEFGAEFDAEELVSVSTVDELASFITQKIG
jgi:acyl carrier protein